MGARFSCVRPVRAANAESAADPVTEETRDATDEPEGTPERSTSAPASTSFAVENTGDLANLSLSLPSLGLPALAVNSSGSSSSSSLFSSEG